jgi:hypothetical protein
MSRVPAPFLVRKGKTVDGWILLRREAPGFRFVKAFETPGQAIDHAYRNWPWWP